MTKREAKRRACREVAALILAGDEGWCAYDGLEGEDVNRLRRALEELAAELESRGGEKGLD